MYLSARELTKALKNGSLICTPFPCSIGSTSIDLRLDSIDEAKVWDFERLKAHNRDHGFPENELRVASLNYKNIATLYLRDLDSDTKKSVFWRHDELVLKPGAFALWQTKEIVGTPEIGAKFICFIDGKSTRARAGLVIHLTAPTIHAGWSGNVALELANLGPFDLVLKENEIIAQITVARITSSPQANLSKAGSVTYGQGDVTGTQKKNGR